jgi:hypothetical protein
VAGLELYARGRGPQRPLVAVLTGANMDFDALGDVARESARPLGHPMDDRHALLHANASARIQPHR